MESLTVSSQKEDKSLRAQVVEDGDILLHFDGNTFGDFVSNLLREKQLLEKKYAGTIILTHNELVEFCHLIQHKFRSQSNIFSDTVSIRIFYNNGESHVLHGIEKIDKYNEPRNIVPVKINLKFKCFIKDTEDDKIYNTSVSIVIQILEKNPYGEISLAIQHNDRLFASEVLHHLEPLVERVIRKPTIFHNIYVLIKKTKLHFLWFFYILVISTVLTFSFFTYTPVSGITKLSQQSVGLLEKTKGYYKYVLKITREYRKAIGLVTSSFWDSPIVVEDPKIKFQSLLLEDKLVTSESFNLSLLLSSYVGNINIPTQSASFYMSSFRDRIFTMRGFSYGGSEDEQVIISARNDKYISPYSFNNLEKAQKSHFFQKKRRYIISYNNKIFRSIEELSKKRYVSKEYKAFLKKYLNLLKKDLLVIDEHIENIINIENEYDPIFFEIEKNILKLKEELSKKPTYTVTDFTKYILVVSFFPLPIFILLHLLNESKSFLSLNGYTRKLEKINSRRQFTFKASLFVTLMISVGCSLTASAIYDFLSYFF